ncbi:MAG: OmpH family outer membrane protein [Candidatus Aminicenantales bacterium]
MKRKYSATLIFSAVFCLVFISLGFAQEKSFAVINSQKVLEESVEGKRVIAQLQEKDQKTQNELAKMDEEIRQLETKLNTQRLTLSQESILQLTSDLERKRTERKRHAEDALRDFQELQLRLYNRLQNELLPIIKQIGKEKGFKIIFDLSKSGAVYWDEAIDITDEVIKRYDAFKSGKK